MPAGQESRGKAWFKDRDAFSKSSFEQQYSGLANDLHTCCVQKFNRCLQAVQEQTKGRGSAEAGAVELCVQRFSPEHQPKVALSGAPAAAGTPAAGGAGFSPPPADNPCAQAARRSSEQELKALAAERDGFEKELTRCQHITNEMAYTLAELRQSCEQRQAGETQRASGLRDEITLLTRQNDAYEVEWRRIAADRDRLQASLTAAAPHPGSAALLAFPAGPASLELGLAGAAALAVGFLLGLPGRRGRRRQLLSAAVSACLTLLVFLGIAFFLQDTRRPDLLLAVTAAALLASLRTLLRISVLRRRGPTPGAP
jgi:hypothetical protein